MRTRTYNTTLHWMGAIAGIGLMLALFLSRDLVQLMFWGGALALVILIPGIVLQGWLEHLIGVACLNCGTHLQLVGMKAFGDRFYRCPECAARYRRGAIPILSVLLDAPEPKFDRYFHRRSAENPWTHPPELVDEDEVGELSKTHGTLLRNKRRRNPDSPNVL